MATKKVAAVSGDTNSAVLSERLRVSSILESLEGQRNPKLANELALRTALDAEAARAILAQAPVANPYLAAMEAQGPIGLSAGMSDFSGDNRAARRREIAEVTAMVNEQNGYTPKSKR